MKPFLLSSRGLLACAVALGAAACAVGCADTESTETTPAGCVPSDGPLPHDKLSDYCLFEEPLNSLTPAEGVVPFDVAAALWSDHAAKDRLIALPKGEKIKFDEGEAWQFPVGTILVKTFSFYDDFRDLSTPRNIVETRLLILHDDGWTGHVYLWNEDKTDADRIVAGEHVDLTFTDESGETTTEQYIVPNDNQCKNCHKRDDVMHFLGPFTHQLNRSVTVDGKAKNQLEHMAELGMFDSDIPATDSLPAFPDPFGDAALDDRARGYLHANCSHCHRPGGGGGPSGLVLLAWEKDPAKNGVCKQPAAAGPGTGGHEWDIVPGHPEESILVFRISSTDPEIKMPELPNKIVDKKGVALVSEWITAMQPEGCPGL